MKKILFALILMLSFHASSHALTGVFWQPQHRDLSISSKEWKDVFKRVKTLGIDTLVVQWSNYGTSFSSQDYEALVKVVHLAAEEELKIILGLHSDPKFFELQKQSVNSLPYYLTHLTALDIKALKQWLSSLSIEIDGWYLSAEIDDLNWRNSKNQEILLHWLEEVQEAIKKESSAPVYISSFFVAHMSPDSYHDLLKSIQRLGIKVWVQDGSGVNKLSINEQQLYLNQLLSCATAPPIDGVIYELFEEQKNVASFQATPKPFKQIKKLSNPSVCNGSDTLYFSLRYLQNIQNPLQYK